MAQAKKKTWLYDVETQRVTIKHECESIETDKEGKKIPVMLTTTFDFSTCTPEQKLYFMGSDRKIAFRRQHGTQDMSVEQIQALDNQVVDCSILPEREKREMSPAVKEARETVAALKAGGLTEDQIIQALRDFRKAREEAEMEAGETS